MENIQETVFTQAQIQQIRQEWAEVLKPLKEFMTVDELAKYLELSKSAIYKLTSKRELPFYNPGGKKIYFKREEVDTWIKAGRIAPDSEILEQFNEPTINSNSRELW
jgi:excisionase family DNA binding protein